MCGYIYSYSKRNKQDIKHFKTALDKIIWRGPDSQNYFECNNHLFGHNRLEIIFDTKNENNQPFKINESEVLLFNGEIYNHLELRRKHRLKCNSQSDTETLAKLYEKLGIAMFHELDGMFAITIVNTKTNTWLASRDFAGIKPLYYYNISGQIIISSETSAISTLAQVCIDEESIREWELFRSPISDHTFFKQIKSFTPGKIHLSDGRTYSFENTNKSSAKLHELLTQEIEKHELSNVENVSLLSGGVDSALITALSSVSKAYSVGVGDANEFSEARSIAEKLGKEIECVHLEREEYNSLLRDMIIKKGCPLFLPNEVLIAKVCNSMKKTEKVVLTGEGADELFWGYDRIFSYASQFPKFSMETFFKQYCYKSAPPTNRSKEYIEDLSYGKTYLEFLDEFFWTHHLQVLLRRMDFASMFASKEARVPFVSLALFNLMKDKNFADRTGDLGPKTPLKLILLGLGIKGPINMKKIGFSTVSRRVSNKEEYEKFRKINLETLGWQ